MAAIKVRETATSRKAREGPQLPLPPTAYMETQTVCRTYYAVISIEE